MERSRDGSGAGYILGIDLGIVLGIDQGDRSRGGGRDLRKPMEHPFLRRRLPLVYEDLSSTYARNLHKWLLVAPLVGVTVGLTMTALAELVLRAIWPPVLAFYLHHHWAILPGVTVGCAVAGLIMQYTTPDPNEHSTEEVIKSYHEHGGAVRMRSVPQKLLAAVATVGSGGSAALEGPSIYGGAALGSWWWTRLRGIARLRLDDRDRRILLICGAAAGMSAVFRAPFTGIVFALEMPYKDDLAHEALLPSLIASVTAYLTLGVVSRERAAVQLCECAGVHGCVTFYGRRCWAG